jgi:hypothetical protein
VGPAPPRCRWRRRPATPPPRGRGGCTLMLDMHSSMFRLIDKQHNVIVKRECCPERLCRRPCSKTLASEREPLKSQGSMRWGAWGICAAEGFGNTETKVGFGKGLGVGRRRTERDETGGLFCVDVLTAWAAPRAASPAGCTPAPLPLYVPRRGEGFRIPIRVVARKLYIHGEADAPPALDPHAVPILKHSTRTLPANFVSAGRPGSHRARPTTSFPARLFHVPVRAC